MKIEICTKKTKVITPEDDIVIMRLDRMIAMTLVK